MKKKSAVLLLAGCLPVIAMAQSIGSPTLKSGDTWTYMDTLESGPSGWRQTHDVVSLNRVTSSHIYVTTKPVNATTEGREIVMDADWSRAREIDGNETVVNRPLAFPLETGKSWRVQYTEAHPKENPGLSTITWTTKYKVVGYEDIEVPAGKFHALKIEAEGDWKGVSAASNGVVQAAQMQAGQTTLITQARHVTPENVGGNTYKAFWYAPEVGRWVKSVEEYYGSNGVRSQRYTSELENYKVGG